VDVEEVPAASVLTPEKSTMAVVSAGQAMVHTQLV